MFVTFFDTCLVTLTAIFVWRIRPYYVVLPWLTIASLDGTFISSVLLKVPSGAWVTLMLASVLASVFLVWRYGKEQQWFAEAEDRLPTSHFLQIGPDNQLHLTERFHGGTVANVKGFGIFFDKAGETTPIVFSQFALKLSAIPEFIVFLHLRPLEEPSVSPEDRHSVSRLAIPNCYRLVFRYGFNDEVISPDLASVVYEQIRLYKVNEMIKNRQLYGLEDGSLDDNIVQSSETTAGNFKTEPHDSEVAELEAAYLHKVLYIMGKEQMKVKANRNYLRRFFLYIFLWMRENTRTKMANLNVSRDSIIEVGFVKEI